MAATAKPARPRTSVEQYGPAGRSPWMDVDWRTHQRWVTVARRPVNVIDLGPPDGTPPAGTIVWIHGLSGSWQNWLENLPVFARTWRCIALDLPGFGASPMPAERISITGYAAIVDELLRVLGVEHAVVVGNSMGGFVGAEIAIRFGTWVDKLVLVSSAGLATEHQRYRPLLPALRVAGAALALGTSALAAAAEPLAARPRSRQALLRVVAAHPGRLPGPLAAEQLRGLGKPGFVDALDALITYPLRDRLASITAPTLVVWGQNDPLVPVRDAWRFGELIPDARVVVYEDTGHVAMFERPEAFNALVAAFLEE